MNRLIRKLFARIHFAALRLRIHNPPPWLKAKDLQRARNKNRHAAFHECYLQYIRDVSSADMAVSFECATLLSHLCALFSCKQILDLGSGFSSYTFRRYALNDSATVWSVDDDEGWIRKTRAFLHAQNLSAKNLMMLDEFMHMPERDFDLIFLDLNFVEVRRNFIKLVVERCKPGGMIVFDDVHKREFLYDVLRLTKREELTFFTLKSITRDEFGRYALLGIKNA